MRRQQLAAALIDDQFIAVQAVRAAAPQIAPQLMRRCHA